MSRRYNCRCGKRRFRDEQSALAAATTDREAHGEPVTVYRCPGGLAWHLTAHGFTPEALRSIGRRLAFDLAEHGHLDLADFRARALHLDTHPDPRRHHRVRQCAEQLAALGLAHFCEPSEHLVAAYEPGLRRVVQIGLDAYAHEHTADPPRTS